MLRKAFEWLRTADLKPDDNLVGTRTKAGEDLLNRIRKSEDYDLLINCVTATVAGFELFSEQSPTVQTVLECIRTQQPAFPSALAENALHLRVCCALSLGELLVSPSGASQNNALMAASLLLSGLGARPAEGGRHLGKVCAELAAAARDYLQRRAVASREKPELDLSELTGLENHAGNPPTFNQKLIPVLKKLIQTLETRHESDREELEVMWWLYNGFSERLGKPITGTPIMLAAAAIGREVADRVVPPATVGLRELVAHAAVRDRTAAQVRGKSIEKIVGELGEPGRKLLLTSDNSVKDLVRETAPVLPLSWLCLRLEESRGAAGWEQELEAKTGLSAEQELTPDELAAHVFDERQAQRVYKSLIEE